MTDTIVPNPAFAHHVMSEGCVTAGNLTDWNVRTAINHAYAVINDSAAETIPLPELVTTSADNISGQGYVGMPIPYRINDDSIIASCIILCFVILTWITASSWRYVRIWLQDFFVNRERPNLFVKPEDTSLNGRHFVSLLPCLTLAVLLVDVINQFMPTLLVRYWPYTVLLASIALLAIYFTLTTMLRQLVDHLFLDPQRIRKWHDNYRLSDLMQSILLIILTLVSIYHGIAPRDTLIMLAVIFLIIKIPLLYKCYTTFFDTRIRYINTFLYFCALEVAPVLVMIQIIRQVMTYICQG